MPVFQGPTSAALSSTVSSRTSSTPAQSRTYKSSLLAQVQTHDTSAISIAAIATRFFTTRSTFPSYPKTSWILSSALPNSRRRAVNSLPYARYRISIPRSRNGDTLPTIQKQQATSSTPWTCATCLTRSIASGPTSPRSSYPSAASAT